MHCQKGKRSVNYGTLHIISSMLPGTERRGARKKKDTKRGKWQTRLQTLPICDTFKRCASINTATSGRTYALPVAQKKQNDGGLSGLAGGDLAAGPIIMKTPIVRSLVNPTTTVAHWCSRSLYASGPLPRARSCRVTKFTGMRWRRLPADVITSYPERRSSESRQASIPASRCPLITDGSGDVARINNNHGRTSL